MSNDHDLQEEVVDELRWDPEVEATEIGVTVKDGVVTVRGEVSSLSQRWAVERAIKRVRGVRAVADEITVQLPGLSERTDVQLAEAAANVLAWSTIVPRDHVKVTVQDGWITLDGTVQWWYQKRAAEDIVRSLTGVKGISNQVTVVPHLEPQAVTFDDPASLRAERAARRAAHDRGNVWQQGSAGRSAPGRSWKRRSARPSRPPGVDGGESAHGRGLNDRRIRAILSQARIEMTTRKHESSGPPQPGPVSP